jgi:hypothetical protein
MIVVYMILGLIVFWSVVAKATGGCWSPACAANVCGYRCRHRHHRRRP